MSMPNRGTKKYKANWHYAGYNRTLILVPDDVEPGMFNIDWRCWDWAKMYLDQSAFNLELSADWLKDNRNFEHVMIKYPDRIEFIK